MPKRGVAPHKYIAIWAKNRARISRIFFKRKVLDFYLGGIGAPQWGCSDSAGRMGRDVKASGMNCGESSVREEIKSSCEIGFSQ